VAGFLVEAARADVSSNTVVQVLLHWVCEGMSAAEVLAAVATARDGAGSRHHPAIDAFEQAIRGRLDLCGPSSPDAPTDPPPA
jgi:hypothetical protein